MEDEIIKLQRAIATVVNRISARTWNNDEYNRSFTTEQIKNINIVRVDYTFISRLFI
jgi:hypothetical protein